MKKSIFFFCLLTCFFSNLSFSQYQLSQEQIVNGYNFLKENGSFKNPSSLKYNGHTVSKKQFSRECFTWVKYDVSAQNGFGGFVRSDFIVYFFDGQPIFIESENGAYFMWANNDAVPDKIIPLAKHNGIVVGDCAIEIERQKERQKNEENNRIKLEKIKIDQLNLMIENKEYYKSYQTYLSLTPDLKKNFNETKIFQNWNKQEREIDSLYLLYKKEYTLKLVEYNLNKNQFLSDNSQNIKDNEVEVDFNSFITKKTNSNNIGNKYSEISDNFFVYSFVDSQHLITPVGIFSNYFIDSVIVNNCDIELQVSFDTLTKGFYSKLNFKNSEIDNIFSGYIVNPNNFLVKKYTMPYSNLLDNYIKKLINESSISFVQQEYPQLSFSIDYFQKLTLEKYKTSEYPGKNMKNNQYELLKNKFNSQINSFSKYIGLKGAIKTSKFYNPSIIYFIKKLYPNSDTLIFTKNLGEKLKKELGILAIHVNYDETNKGTNSGDSQAHFGSIIPLQKNVLEFKNNKLLVFDKQGNFKELSIEIIAGSLYSLADFNLDKLEVEDEIYLEKDYYKCPFYYQEVQIGKSNSNFLLNTDDKTYYYNNSVIIQELPIYPLNGKVNPSLITYYQATGYDRNKMAWSYISIESYLKNMVKYAEYKKNGDLKKANKSLLKAEKDINVFKEKYSIVKYD
jgi:hypothetical protein